MQHKTTALIKLFRVKKIIAHSIIANTSLTRSFFNCSAFLHYLFASIFTFDQCRLWTWIIWGAKTCKQANQIILLGISFITHGGMYGVHLFRKLVWNDIAKYLWTYFHKNFSIIQFIIYSGENETVHCWM